MKKLIIFIIIFVLLLGACSSRPLVSSIDLSSVGPRSNDELSSSRDVVVTVGVQPESERRLPVREVLAQVSTVTTETTWNKVDDETEVRVFTSQLQTTQVRIPDRQEIETQINSTLERAANQNTAEAEEVQQSGELSYAETDASGTGSAGSDFYAFSYSTSQTVTRLDTAVFSVVTYASGYRGGAHSTSTQSAANFDLTTGERMALADILLPEQRDAVYAMIVQWLESRTEDYDLFSMEQCLPIVSDKFSPEDMKVQYTDWYLTDEGLTVFFNPFEISPYSSGIIKIELGYGQLSAALSPRYQPTLIDDQPLGSFTVYYNTAPGQMATRQETVQLASGTDRLIIWGAEPIYDVSLTRVSWIGGQSVDIGTLYCANYLTADNMVIIELDGAYSLSTLCLRLNPGDGEERTIYFESELAPGAYAYNFSGVDN